MSDVFVSEKKGHTPLHVKNVERKEGHTHNPLAAYCYYPDNLSFSTKDDKETIVLLLRRHPITNVPWLVIAGLMFFAPLILTNFPILNFLPERFQLVGIFIWYLLLMAYVLESFLDWYYNVNIITDERVIDVDFVNLIYREMTDANLDKIQDVTVVFGGVVRSIFNFGTLLIQTAGEKPEIDFVDVPNPDEAAKILRDLREMREGGGNP